MFRIARYLKGFQKQVIIGPIFKLTEAIFELIVPLVMARIIDVGVKNQDVGYILRMGAVLAAFALSGVVCALTAQYFAAKASMGFGTKLRADLYRHVNRLSFAELDTAGAPTLITRLTSTGLLKPCLCYEQGVELRPLLRGGADDTTLRDAIRAAILQKPAAHCFAQRENITEHKSMNQIGG